MDNKKLKKLMTDVAKGKITQSEVDKLIKPKTQIKSKKEDNK